jgi:predicted nuclease of predicted toxin-antitoxin system
MPVLPVLVDYDNVDRSLTTGGPTNCAKILAQVVPTEMIKRFDSILVRLYGGWRSNGTLTHAAQRLVPDIRASSPTMISFTDGATRLLRKISVELAEQPIGLTFPLTETLARDRSLRRFRANPHRLVSCTNVPNCGLTSHFSLNERTPCTDPACSMVIGDLLVRDEQKMVDTLLVADIAHQTFVAKTTDIVVVSSDTDMWPGVLLALQNSCNILQVHTRGSRTQRHLLQSITRTMSGVYREVSS